MPTFRLNFQSMNKKAELCLAMVLGCAHPQISPGATAAVKVPNPPVLLGPQPGRPARDLIGSLGINVHMTYYDTPYVDVTKVQQALAHLGLDNVRDASLLADTSIYDTLASHGVRFNFLLRSEVVKELDATVKRLEAFQQRHPGAILAIEGMNEINFWPAKYHGMSEFPAGVAVQRDLYAAVKSSPTLKALPVYALTLGAGGPADYDRLGNLSDEADYGNAHIYFNKGAPPSSVWDQAYALARRATPGLPQAVVTETGYTTSKGSPQAVDEQVQAKYLLTLVMEVWRKKVVHTFIYQLVEDSKDDTDWTRGLGLYRYDWSPKPAADALHNLTQALTVNVPASRANDSKTLKFELRTAQGSVNSLPVIKANGAFDLIVWQERKLWDGDARRPIVTDPARMTLILPSGPAQISVLDPLDGKRSQLAARNGEFDFDLPDHPLILELPTGK